MKFLAGARGMGGAVALCRPEPAVQSGRRALGHAKELLQPVVAVLPHEVSQPEHVLTELVKGGPSWRVVAGNRAELRLCCFGHQPEAENPCQIGTSGAPQSHSSRFVPGREVAARLLYRIGGSEATGSASGRSPRACALGPPPARRKGGTAAGAWQRRRAAPSRCGDCAAPVCGRLWPAAPHG